MANQLGSFALIGIENMKFFDREDSHVTTLEHGKDIDISNASSTTYLRGGLGNKKLLAIKGDSESTITLNHATMTSKLWEIISGNKLTTEQKPVEIDEEYTISAKSVTLKTDIAPSGKITVYKVDAFGRDSEKIIVGDPTTEEDNYSIVGKVITFHANVTGKVRVYYPVMKEVQVITSKPVTAENYRITADLICKDISDKKTYVAQLVIPNGQIQENFSVGATNEATEPAAIPLAIDCLEDSVSGKFYEILFYEE